MFTNEMLIKSRARFRKKIKLKRYYLAIHLLIYPLFHFSYFRGGESRLINTYFYNAIKVIQEFE